jgi:hypothetical protein
VNADSGKLNGESGKLNTDSGEVEHPSVARWHPASFQRRRATGMPAERLSMRRIREVLRLKRELGLSHRAVAKACSLGLGTVTLYLQRAAEADLGWPLPAELDDAGLEAQLFPRDAGHRTRVAPSCTETHLELKRDGVTLRLLWEEYLGIYPEGYRYSQFCEISMPSLSSSP